MVGRLACDPTTSSLIAAFAPVSGAFYTDYQGPCYPSRSPIPILEFHGGSDTYIPYEGGEDSDDRGVTEPIPQWLQEWAARDQCDAGNQTVQLTDAEGTNNVNRTTWTCGGEDGVVTHYFSSYLGHVWPTEADAGYNATSVIMRFFDQWTLPLLKDQAR